MGRPPLEPGTRLCLEAMSLVDADDPRPTARNMPEDRLDHLKADAEPLQAGRGRSAKVMKSPWGEGAPLDLRRLSVELRLGFRPAGYRSSSVRTEDERPRDARQRCDDLERHGGQGDVTRLAV